MISSPPRIAIIGAGPVGLETALAARQADCHVDLYEQGRVANNVESWGHVRLFSPFEMNSSCRGRAALKLAGHELPLGTDYLTGRQFAASYLHPLSQLPELQSRIYESTTVEGISRTQFGKGKQIGKQRRNESLFLLLIKNKTGEHYREADVVIDCSGTYGHGNHVGPGGLPALGERECLNAANYRLPDILGQQRADYAGKTTLIVGNGYSAATAVSSIAHLAEQIPNTKACWLTRAASDQPMQHIDGDILPIREQLTAIANQLALSPSSPIQWMPGDVIQKIERTIAANTAGEGYRVTTTDSNNQSQTFDVDQIIAHAGFHPNRNIYRELQVHECYATEGPIKLAASLLSNPSADCLQQSSGGIDTLINPEPGFFILGAKSFGRSSQFLMQTGIEQVEAVFDFLLNRSAATQA